MRRRINCWGSSQIGGPGSDPLSRSGSFLGKGVRTVIGAVIVVFNWSKFEDFQKSVNVVNAAKAEALKGRVADVCIYLLLQ
jgi:hypothetical protein